MKKRAALCTGDIVLTEDCDIGAGYWPVFGILGQDDSSINAFKKYGLTSYVVAPVHCVSGGVITYEKTIVQINDNVIKVKVGKSEHIKNHYEETLNDIYPAWNAPCTNLKPLEDDSIIEAHLDILFGDHIDITAVQFFRIFMRNMSPEMATKCINAFKTLNTAKLYELFHIDGSDYGLVIKKLKERVL